VNLNIGCGSDKWGDIRLDIHRTLSTNLIVDAQNLPFKPNSFKLAKVSHVLEHLVHNQVSLFRVEA